LLWFAADSSNRELERLAYYFLQAVFAQALNQLWKSSSAQRYYIDKHELQPKAEERSWRTRPDPLAEVWEGIVVPMLERDNEITPVGIT